MVEVANHDALLAVKLEAMDKVGTSKSRGNQARLTQQIGGRVCIGVDGRKAQIAAVLGEDKMRAVVHAHRVAANSDAQPGLAQKCRHLLAGRPCLKFSGDVHGMQRGA